MCYFALYNCLYGSNQCYSRCYRILKDAIRKQVAKIISDPLFEKSGILKNFLLFIVEETINGHANQLKEYTIALSILHKPLDFKPQENGILRIHAGRLRKALEQYYHSSGTTDAIHIFIPKGSYVPVLSLIRAPGF